MLGNPTALHQAVYDALENVARPLLSRAGAGLELASGQILFEYTPLHLACNKGRNVMELLLVQGECSLGRLEAVYALSVAF